jgi:mannose/fructose/N-acetylgalactosamine-specific phosphotransferase system component IID
MADNTTNPDEKTRSGIATQIIIYGTVVLGLVAVTIVVAGLIIANHDNGKSPDKGMSLVTDVFHSILPVIAAWIGAVIAFYFGKEKRGNCQSSYCYE